MMRVKKKIRQKLLLDHVAEKPFLTDEDLAKLLQVSIQTIRLDRLELVRQTAAGVSGKNNKQTRSLQK